jgi:hypothetical protein
VTWLDDLTLNTVIVHTRGGSSFRGLKRGVYDDALLLWQAAILEDEGRVTMLDGDVVIPREQVHFIQAVGGDG